MVNDPIPEVPPKHVGVVSVPFFRCVCGWEVEMEHDDKGDVSSEVIFRTWADHVASVETQP